MPRENTILVTVGSTRFDALVYKAVSESFLACVCRALGPQAEVWIQYGHSACALPSGAKKGTLRNTEGVWIDTQGQAKTFAFAFTPDLRSWIDHAGLVISHGGSGTIIEVLRSDHAPKLLVMPNTTLMHDHQRELVQQLSQEGYLSMGHIDNIDQMIPQVLSRNYVRFPTQNTEAVKRVVESVWC
ncbi:UDP-N-acetylglucosamine transferase subunit ALG13 [Malassezia restricta CBS 7877]|uniref:UDP-N-acetylglucosamine transferase subunit ALG13 n=1 Tax=Malassezia restricta (strain ATCC 96810 / NBRC 103918 / CBS 7877) TaxID=425264 RepID=A0A3G2S9I6_MALR7|nr:UDP-N-acetylglucosamine transferase subunit ALG13 [Malassezia restricta CBS 7877]